VGVTGAVTAHLTGEPEELLHLIAAQGSQK